MCSLSYCLYISVVTENVYDWNICISYIEYSNRRHEMPKSPYMGVIIISIGKK